MVTLEFALDHFIDFFLRMEVLVNRRTAGKVVMGECHVLRVEISTVPTRQSLDDWKAACIQKGHGSPVNMLSYTRPPIKAEARRTNAFSSRRIWGAKCFTNL
jgi:hypothetical protein